MRGAFAPTPLDREIHQHIGAATRALLKAVQVASSNRDPSVKIRVGIVVRALKSALGLLSSVGFIGGGPVDSPTVRKSPRKRTLVESPEVSDE